MQLAVDFALTVLLHLFCSPGCVNNPRESVGLNWFALVPDFDIAGAAWHFEVDFALFVLLHFANHFAVTFLHYFLDYIIKLGLQLLAVYGLVLRDCDFPHAVHLCGQRRILPGDAGSESYVLLLAFTGISLSRASSI